MNIRDILRSLESLIEDVKDDQLKADLKSCLDGIVSIVDDLESANNDAKEQQEIIGKILY